MKLNFENSTKNDQQLNLKRSITNKSFEITKKFKELKFQQNILIEFT